MDEKKMIKWYTLMTAVRIILLYTMHKIRVYLSRNCNNFVLNLLLVDRIHACIYRVFCTIIVMVKIYDLIMCLIVGEDVKGSLR